MSVCHYFQLDCLAKEKTDIKFDTITYKIALAYSLRSQKTK